MAQQLIIDGNLEADDASEAEFSNYSSADSLSYKSSISSSIRKYIYENGRRYHAYREGEYVLPNDEQEQDRMDLLHHVFLLVLGGRLHRAPIPKHPQRVLDLGTGTGIWAIDFADQYPSAQVIGNDLSPIQPVWTPPNCAFEVDDFEAEWPFGIPFDYIHGRELAGSVRDFDRLCKQAFTHLKPGGYFEMQCTRIEMYSDDGTLEKATFTKKWIELLQQASETFGKPMASMDEWPEKMTKAGFEEVDLRIAKLPMSPWPKDPKLKEIGSYMRYEQPQAAMSYTNALLSRILGWGKQEIDVLLAHVLSEHKDMSIHQYSKLYLMHGKKPG